MFIDVDFDGASGGAGDNWILLLQQLIVLDTSLFVDLECRFWIRR